MGIQMFPELLPDGELYAVAARGYYAYFTYDDKVCLSRNVHYFSPEMARKVAKALGYGRVIKVKKSDKPPQSHLGAKFFIKEKSDDTSYAERDVHTAPFVRYIYENPPEWFITAVKKVAGNSSWWFEDLPGGDGENSVGVFCNEPSHPWMDHAGWSSNGYKNDSEEVLVAEPYHLDDSDIRDLVETCKRFNFNFRITGKSAHYPSSCVRVTIQPNREEAAA
jgi:hypothetical protein